MLTYPSIISSRRPLIENSPETSRNPVSQPHISYAGNAKLKSMTAVLNKFLNLANLELRPSRQTLSTLMSYPKRATAGQIIEFIGTQGIGKSTLNNDLHKPLKDNWFFRANLGEVGPATVSSVEIEQLHRDIYFSKILHLEKAQPDPWKSITTSRQMSKVISESLTILTNTFPRGFILDESLFKNFPREVLDVASEKATPLWANRAFIYLRARDPDFVVSRYQGRVAERGRRGLSQLPPTDAEVRERVMQDNDLFDRIFEEARVFDCPAIIIYAEDAHQGNVEKILNFDKVLRNKA